MSTRADLIQLLKQREQIIADHSWRDRDAEGHLDALKNVSEEITAWAEQCQSPIEPKLNHFLSNASFSKALAHLEKSPS